MFLSIWLKALVEVHQSSKKEVFFKKWARQEEKQNIL